MWDLNSVPSASKGNGMAGAVRVGAGSMFIHLRYSNAFTNPAGSPRGSRAHQKYY